MPRAAPLQPWRITAKQCFHLVRLPPSSAPVNDLQPSPDDVPPIIVPIAAGIQPIASARRIGWWVHLLLIAALPLAVFLLGLRHTPLRGPALTHSVFGLLYVCAIQLAIFAVLFLLAVLASRASNDDLLLAWRPGWRVLPLGLGYSIALRIALAAIGILAVIFLMLMRVVSEAGITKFSRAKAPDVEALVDVSALQHNPTYLVLTLTLVSFVVAGLREELWRTGFLAAFRRLWPQHFAGLKGEMKAIVIAAVLFGAAHSIQGPIAVLMTFLLGIGLGAIMVYHRSIWPGVFAHGFFDATSLALIPFVIEHLRGLKT